MAERRVLRLPAVEIKIGDEVELIEDPIEPMRYRYGKSTAFYLVRGVRDSTMDVSVRSADGSEGMVERRVVVCACERPVAERDLGVPAEEASVLLGAGGDLARAFEEMAVQRSAVFIESHIVTLRRS
jgi:hypothetical protein